MLTRILFGSFFVLFVIPRFLKGFRSVEGEKKQDLNSNSSRPKIIEAEFRRVP